MKISALIGQAFTAIFANKVRSFLTVLGIVIGIGSVIALISLGDSVSNTIGENFSSLGSAMITVNSKPVKEDTDAIDEETDQNEDPGIMMMGRDHGEENGMRAMFMGVVSDPTLTEQDFNDIRNLGEDKVTAVSPEISKTSDVAYNDLSKSLTVTGVDIAYFQIEGYEIAEGVLFSNEDIAGKSKVVVLASQSYNDLFGSENAIDEVITIDEEECRVIGVLSEKKESQFINPNEAILLPYSSALESFDQEMFTTISVEAANEEIVSSVCSEIETLLLANHEIADTGDADFTIISSQDILDMQESTMAILTGVFAAIAGISLVVGGIGIMNIMLVSVTERTKEIGLRKAVGAKTYHILIQFLTESVILTLVGGLVGIGIGYLISLIAARMISITTVLSIDAVVLAVSISGAVGIVFGLYPAWKAARLDPVDALRYE
ncbi:ABC transporter permease [Patescibacteria group bacterium]|nr:ABC transporter permease [Patescibacteria group bacterium]